MLHVYCLKYPTFCQQTHTTHAKSNEWFLDCHKIFHTPWSLHVLAETLCQHGSSSGFYQIFTGLEHLMDYAFTLEPEA